MSKFQQVKQFILHDLEFFHNVDYEDVNGAMPTMVFYNKNKEAVERIDLQTATREEINELLIKKGFYKKSNHDEEVPEEYKEGPYVEKDEL
ncbi:selenoprotein M-like [Scylla paramamosain]|uniref:selenoprotein M-like n=1 Tax=Scylla paramamosain TaxID=85552 RepID=UPI003083AA4C